jgi:hypothetical protein
MKGRPLLSLIAQSIEKRLESGGDCNLIHVKAHTEGGSIREAGNSCADFGAGEEERDEQIPQTGLPPLEQGERWIAARDAKEGGILYQDMRSEVRKRCLAEAKRK